MKKIAAGVLALSLMSSLPMASADEYVIDTEGAHAFIQFRVKHLGYSWLYGRFNDFSGNFTYDEKDPSKNQVTVKVDTTSVDSNHARRDKHIRNEDFLDTDKFAEATFKSTKYTPEKDGKGKLQGNLTMHGVTKPITIDVEHIGGGDDPWGGYRQGFEGRATIKPEEWGIPMVEKLGAASAEVELMLSVEGVRKEAGSKKK